MDSRFKNEQTDMLARALLAMESEEDCYAFLEDLCTVREIHDLSQRLEVAMLLKKKATYAEIVEKTGASTATIGRVNRALSYGTGGYDAIIARISDQEE